MTFTLNLMLETINSKSWKSGKNNWNWWKQLMHVKTRRCNINPKSWKRDKNN